MRVAKADYPNNREFRWSDEFLRNCIRVGAYSTESRLRNHLNYMFSEVPLSGSRVLDVGAGNGLLSAAAASAGATVVALEPASDGSSVRAQRIFGDLIEACAVSGNVSIRNQTLQDFLTSSVECSFDVVMMANTINHLDEISVINALGDSGARGSFLEIFTKLASILTPQAVMVITDCGRRNVFNEFGFRSPLAPDIEWNKHQEPEFWSRLLDECGFRETSISWSTPNSLGSFGRYFLANRFFAFLLLSHFRLQVALAE